MDHSSTFQIARLNFIAPLHLSKGKQSTLVSSHDFLSADALKSALFVTYLRLFGGQEKVDKSFFDQFFISSTFPYYQDELFFPKPMAGMPFQEEAGINNTIAERSKRLRKLKYIGKSYFEAMLQQKRNMVYNKAHFIDTKGAFLSNTIPKLTNKEYIQKKHLQHRVKVPPAWKGGENIDAEPFQIVKNYFHPQAGLFFLIEFKEVSPEFQQQIKFTLQLLGEEGLGTQRHLGNGRFLFDDFEEITLALPPQNASIRWLNLGTYCPQSKEEIKPTILENSAYQLMKRGGWISSPDQEEHNTFRKKSIYMFVEGSVFAFPDSYQKYKTNGAIHDLRPDEFIKEGLHEVWRDGRGFFIPISNSN